MRTTDPALTAVEALDLATKLDVWPAGLGFVLEPASTVRGWRRAKYRPFGPPPVESTVCMHCPVVQLHEARRAPNDRRNYFAGHLSAWRSIRNAVADVLGMELDAAHQHYNQLLRTDPRELARILRAYAQKNLDARPESC